MKNRDFGVPKVTLDDELLRLLQSKGRSFRADPRERMSEMRQEDLFAIAPAWFDRVPERSIMGYGFTCGEGWFDLLKELFLAIKPLAPSGFSVDQVKQKCGALTVYVSGETPEIRALIKSATARSLSTCEWCGAPGELERPRRFSWVMVLCVACQRLRLGTERPGFN